MQTVTALDPLRSALEPLRRDGPIALVPTMGALHEGHLALVRAARAHAANVVVSIFVNPRQFGPNEDLARYPRPLERDQELLKAEGVRLLWAPDLLAMYPDGYATTVSVAGPSAGLCGGARPGHFDGVATVVAKLFNQVRPDVALFGEKDWQQLAVIRRMARDLDLAVPAAAAIIGVPIVREADGLALSSRNAYLTGEQRAAAAALPREMDCAISALTDGDDATGVLARLVNEIIEAGFASVDYAELRDPDTLEPVADPVLRPARLFVAARIGTTRLIDNKPVR